MELGAELFVKLQECHVELVAVVEEGVSSKFFEGLRDTRERDAEFLVLGGDVVGFIPVRGEE